MKLSSPTHSSEPSALRERRSVYLRAALALVLVPMAVAGCLWLIQGSAHSIFRRSTPGRMVQLYDQIAPQVEERNKQVDDLAGP
jgi:hypothetical protein